MVAYSFQPSFLAPIAAREKQQTIRLVRKRHARSGEAIQLFTGPRMRPTRLGAATCLQAQDVRLDFSGHTVVLDDAITIEAGADFAALDAFAIRDGFRPPVHVAARGVSAWEYMAHWWRYTHPDTPIFRGVLVDWGDTFLADAAWARAA